jgi:hypothetical protein
MRNIKYYFLLLFFSNDSKYLMIAWLALIGPDIFPFATLSLRYCVALGSLLILSITLFSSASVKGSIPVVTLKLDAG